MNGATSNYGVMLWATNEDVAGYTFRFYSSEATPDSIRPKLEVVWSQTSRTVYFLKDHLGSIRAAVYDSANAAKEKWNNQLGLSLACRNPTENSLTKKLDSEPNIRILYPGSGRQGRPM